MHADGPRAVGPHGKPVEASAGTTASDVGAMRESASNNLKSKKASDVRMWLIQEGFLQFLSTNPTLLLSTLWEPSFIHDPPFIHDPRLCNGN